MRRPVFLVLTLALYLLAPAAARAQAVHDPQVWTAVLGNVKLGDEQGPGLWLDVHQRRSGANTVSIIRPGIGWRAAPQLSVWAGYAFVPVLPDDGDAVLENRLWQQVIVQNGWDSGVKLQSRTRFEQRFLSSGSDMGLRVRELVRLSAPLTEDDKAGVVVWDELFVALNETDWGAQPGFDQNRLFTGPYLLTSKKTRLELGYLLAYVNRDEDTVGHVLATNFFWAL